MVIISLSGLCLAALPPDENLTLNLVRVWAVLFCLNMYTTLLNLATELPSSDPAACLLPGSLLVPGSLLWLATGVRAKFGKLRVTSVKE